jgi:hypothetical protein
MANASVWFPYIGKHVAVSARSFGGGGGAFAAGSRNVRSPCGRSRPAAGEHVTRVTSEDITSTSSGIGIGMLSFSGFPAFSGISQNSSNCIPPSLFVSAAFLRANIFLFCLLLIKSSICRHETNGELIFWREYSPCCIKRVDGNIALHTFTLIKTKLRVRSLSTK